MYLCALYEKGVENPEIREHEDKETLIKWLMWRGGWKREELNKGDSIGLQYEYFETGETLAYIADLKQVKEKRYEKQL